MTEREKMAQIIAEHLCPQGKAHKTLYGAERKCYSRDNFAECEKVSECVDALIEAGIGDVRRANAEATVYAKIIHKQDCEIKELREELIGKEKASENAEKASLKTIKECDKKVAKIAHRVEVAERALQMACKDIIKMSGDNFFHNEERIIELILEQAEKELAEEKKDDRERNNTKNI